MLQRLIGEDIVLETHLDDLLGQVLADPDQIHQVIMNLAVNARDAMPDGGMLKIATTNSEVGAEASTAEHPDAVMGRYVLMTVTDSGHAMDGMTRQRIFEPFFTTKEVGKGTGLELAPAQGIIGKAADGLKCRVKWESEHLLRYTCPAWMGVRCLKRAESVSKPKEATRRFFWLKISSPFDPLRGPH